MSNDESRPSGRTSQRRTGGTGQGRPALPVPDLTALTEVFGAAIDGATKMTRARARELAERVLTQAGLENVDLGEAASGATAKINQLADEIIAARTANRELLQRTVSAELEKSLSRLGLARTQEVDDLRDEVDRLRSEVAALRSPAAAPPKKTATRASAARKAATPAPAAKKTAAVPPAKKTAAKAPAAKKTPATKAAATKAAAKRTPARKSAVADGEV